MAATDLERGLEHRGQGWGRERPNVDNFDSEMQEWEDQLQDIQRKIEVLYNEVQARRGGSVMATDNLQNVNQSPGHHGNAIFTPVHHQRTFHPAHHHSNGQSYPVGFKNGVSEIGDLLQDYLGRGKHVSRRNNSARHVHFSDTIKVRQDVPSYQEDSKRRPGNQSVAHEQFLGFEESENRKNRMSHAKSCPGKENPGSKPPFRQKEAPIAQSRSAAQPPAMDSPALDRKCYGPGILGDRKCGSPSVLRKFEAMLQENEGKTLADAGMVTSEVKCATPGGQRRGAAAGSVKAHVQKCHADSEALTAEVEQSQEWGFNLRRGSYSGSKGSYQSPQSRSQVPGSPRTRPRANSATVRKPACHHGEPNMDYRVTNASFCAQKIHRGRLGGQSGCGTDEGLIELLDMLGIQHNLSSRVGHTAYKTESQQVNPSQWSEEEPKKSFSRPARPANQRPPSRWANLTPTSRIAAPLGPTYRPQSPVIRSPNLKTRNQSPSRKQRPIVSYSLPTETVIM